MVVVFSMDTKSWGSCPINAQVSLLRVMTQCGIIRGQARHRQWPFGKKKTLPI